MGVERNGPRGRSLGSFLITAFSALRLAKFNVDDSQHTEFQGLTTTANAMFCASLGWLSAEEKSP